MTSTQKPQKQQLKTELSRTTAWAIENILHRLYVFPLQLSTALGLQGPWPALFHY
jgi:hypothetical protein